LVPQLTKKAWEREPGFDGGIHRQRNDVLKDCFILVTGVFQRVNLGVGGLTRRYAQVGHNSLERLIFLWIIPNGLWIVVPGIVIKQFGAEIMQRLDSREVKRE